MHMNLRHNLSTSNMYVKISPVEKLVLILVIMVNKYVLGFIINYILTSNPTPKI